MVLWISALLFILLTMPSIRKLLGRLFKQKAEGGVQ